MSDRPATPEPSGTEGGAVETVPEDPPRQDRTVAVDLDGGEQTVFKPGKIERLGDFRIVREVGRGGMGIVYEAEQESLGRRVAVKVLPRQMLLDEQHVERFKREAKVAAALHHTNIVQIFGVGEDGGYHYYVMQLIQGVGLDRIIKCLASLSGAGEAVDTTDLPPATRLLCQRLLLAEASGFADGASAPTATSVPSTSDDPVGPEPRPSAADVPGVARPAGTVDPVPPALGTVYWRNIARLGLQVANALDYAHSRDTLHRDIKPSNLLVDDRGFVWVADFGLAKTTRSEDLTRSGQVGGTLRYMAPEQFDGVADSRSETYSLGLTLYEALTLKPAFHDSDQSRLIRKIMAGEAVRPRVLNPAIPRDLETVVLKAAARDPAHRYASAGDLAEDLRRYLAGNPILARKVTVLERLWRWGRRNPAVAGLSAATAVLVLVAATVGWVGYVHTTRALIRESEQLDKTRAEHQRAEGNVALAMQAFDQVFSQLSLGPLATPGGTGEQEENPEFVPVVSSRDADILKGLLAFYARFAAQNQGNPALQLETARAHRRVGQIDNRLGRFEEAAEACRTALAIYQDLPVSPVQTTSRARTLADLCQEIGYAMQMTGRHREAWEYSGRTVAILSELAEDAPGNAEVEFALAQAHLRLGIIPGRRLPERTRPDDARGSGVAEDPVRRAVDIVERLAASDPANPKYRHALALGHRSLAWASLARGQREEGESQLTQAIDALRSLTEEFGAVAIYKHDLVQTCTIGIRFMARRDRRTQAISEVWHERYALALKLASELREGHPDVPAYAATLGRALLRIGEVQMRDGQLADAEPKFTQAIDTFRALVDEGPPGGPYRRDYATALLSLARLLGQAHRFEEAQKMLARGIGFLEAGPSDLGANRFGRPMLSRQYEEMARVLERMGKTAEAEEASRKAEEIRDHADRLRRGERSSERRSDSGG